MGANNRGKKRMTATPKGDTWHDSFLAHLSLCGNIAESARAAGVCRETVYRHRSNNAEFAKGWAQTVEGLSNDRLSKLGGVGGKPSWLLQRIGKHSSSIRACVYLMRCDGCAKIGISTNLAGRIAAMRSSCPYPIELVCLAEFDTRELAAELEDQLHGQYWHRRIHGEWFRLTDGEFDCVQRELFLRGCQV